MALVAATAAHAGFQLTVTFVVYPALATTPDDAWAQVHGGHSRRIAPLVVAVYAALLIAGVGALVTAANWSTIVAAVATLLAIGLTATVAGPLHGRLGRGRDEGRLRLLIRVDRLRTLAALVALTAAILA